MNNPAKNKTNTSQLCEAPPNGDVGSTAPASEKSAVNPRQRPEFTPHLEFLRSERNSGASERELAKRYGKDPSYLHRVLVGDRPVTSELAAVIAAAQPDRDFTWEPPPVPVGAIVDQERAASEDVGEFIDWSKSSRDTTIERAQELIEQLTPEALLRGSPAYAEFRGIIGPALASLLPAIVTVGAVVEFAACCTKISAILADAKQREEKAITNRVAADAHALRTFVDATRNKLKRLLGAVATTPAQLVVIPAWSSDKRALCDALRADVDKRMRLAVELDGGNELCRDAANALRAVRHITFPATQFQNDIIGFFETILGEEPWSVDGPEDDQRSLLLAVQNNKRVVCTSGRGAGKTRGVGGISLWRASCWTDGRVCLTNFTGNQLKAQDWAEILRLIDQSGICLDCRKAGVTQRPCPHSQVLDFAKVSEDPTEGIWSKDRERFIIGVTGKAVMSLGGWHGVHLMVICDEFSGVSQEMMKAWRGNISGAGNKFLGAGNPLDGPGDPMYEAVNNESHRQIVGWYVVTLSAEVAARTGLPYLPSMSEIDIAAKEDETLGRNAPDFVIGVEGRYPTLDELAVFAPGHIIRAQRWENYEATPATGTLVIAIDPAGESGVGDEACIGVLRGLKLLEKRVERGLSLDGYLAIVEDFITRYRDSQNELTVVGIDADGVGQRVITRLDNYLSSTRIPAHQKVNFEIIPVYFGQVAPDSLKYDTCADQAAAHLSNWLNKGGVFEADHRLAQEMRITRWTKLRRKRNDIWYDNVLSATRKYGDGSFHQKLHRSPDRLDMLRVFAYAAYMRDLAPFAEVRSDAERDDEVSQLDSDFSPQQSLREYMRRVKRNPFAG